jgi:transcriptional regulator with PAS, ATPase and Fis domain
VQAVEARERELEATRSSRVRAQEALRGRFAPAGIVANTAAMQRVLAVVERVRDTDVPVVVEGESGTGKELVARALHFSGARAKGAFVVVHCGAIPETLMESELFGHVKGAFTGADRDRKGLIASAHGGTLFLDEVGEMSPRMQVELLRVLQDRKVRPVGGDHDETVDLRVVAASNRPLPALVAAAEAVGASVLIGVEQIGQRVGQQSPSCSDMFSEQRPPRLSQLAAHGTLPSRRRRPYSRSAWGGGASPALVKVPTPPR